MRYGLLWAVLFLLTAAGADTSALPDRAAAILEIRSTGGYREARAPNPFVLLRLFSDGTAHCHCNDYRWAEGRVSREAVEAARKEIRDSGFFTLEGGASKLGAAWRGRFMDTPTMEYRARLDGRSKTYRRNDLGRPEPEALRRLWSLADSLRKKLCGDENVAEEAGP